MTILVAYSEIALKSRYVRSRLERMLANQIGYTLRRNEFSDFKIKRRFGRIYVENVHGEAAKPLARVFGVASTMPSEKTTADIDKILNLLVDVAERTLRKNESFAVRPKVVGSRPYDSRELAVKGGSAILEALKDRNIYVNLDEPSVTFYVEVRNHDAFVYTEIIPGFSGLPYGSQGKMVSLFSGGIDSPVATWLMMKRGVSVLPLFMDQRPHVGESYIERAEEASKKIREYAPVEDFTLYIAPTGVIMDRIHESPSPRFNCILCKRSMYRIAEAFALRKKAKGIITGESLGQVASQTLDNLYTLDSSVNLPVFRPIIGLDKVEIEHTSRKIGTYTITAKKVNGCTVVPDKPATRSRTEDIQELENELELHSLCIEAVNNIEKKTLD
jgi:thiamine biosynthesis protein ThiI